MRISRMVQTSQLISEPKVHTKRINGVTPSDWIDRSLDLAVMLLAIAIDLNVKAKSLTKRLSPSELSKLRCRNTRRGEGESETRNG